MTALMQTDGVDDLDPVFAMPERCVEMGFRGHADRPAVCRAALAGQGIAQTGLARAGCPEDENADRIHVCSPVGKVELK